MNVIENSNEYYKGVENATRTIVNIVDESLKKKISNKNDRADLCLEIVSRISGLLDGSEASIDGDGKEYVMVVSFLADNGDFFYNDREVGFHEMSISVTDELYD